MNDLTNQLIQDTYQRVLQLQDTPPDRNRVLDGTGSFVGYLSQINPTTFIQSNQTSSMSVLTSSYSLIAQSIVGGIAIDYGTVVTASNALSRYTSSISNTSSVSLVSFSIDDGTF